MCGPLLTINGYRKVLADFAAALVPAAGSRAKCRKTIRSIGRQKRRVLDQKQFRRCAQRCRPAMAGASIDFAKVVQRLSGAYLFKGAFVLSMLRSMMRADQAPPGARQKPSST